MGRLPHLFGLQKAEIGQWLTGGLGQLVGPRMDDGMPIDVIDSSHDARLIYCS
jgi:hypothetical protein